VDCVNNTLVLGLGNVIMGDEGVGVHVVRALAQRSPPGVECLDGGTGGFILLEPLQLADRIILIDATDDGQPLGTVTRTRPQFAPDYPPTMTAHDIGVKDLLDAFYIQGGKRDVTLAAPASLASCLGEDRTSALTCELSTSRTRPHGKIFARVFWSALIWPARPDFPWPSRCLPEPASKVAHPASRRHTDLSSWLPSCMNTTYSPSRRKRTPCSSQISGLCRVCPISRHRQARMPRR
jgi:hydrogenase maturation protease